MSDTVKLTVSKAEAQTILDALQAMPWGRVAGLIPKILDQGNSPEEHPDPDIDESQASRRHGGSSGPIFGPE